MIVPTAGREAGGAVFADMHAEQQRALDYLRRKGTDAPTEELRAQLRHAFSSTEEMFDGVAEGERSTPPSDGKWCAHEILDHLVLSHGPAVAQLESLLAGVTPEGIAIPAGLHRDARPSWESSRESLASIHRDLLAAVDRATDALSLDPKAMVEMVVKVDGEAVHWYEPMDWKAFVQGIRVHTLEHRAQLERTLATLRAA